MKSVRKPIGKPIFMPLQIINTWSHFYNECTNIFSKVDKFSAELHPIPVKDEVWHTIGVDLIGPLPETQGKQIHHDSLLSVFQVARHNCSP